MMKFELTGELINQIVFGMENQDADYLFDSETLELIPELEAWEKESGSELSEERFLPLPEWRSVDGFNLMESFVANLRNPVFREELRVILKNGRGVFRQFKNALKDRPDIERLWFRHRQKEMSSRVLSWYNDYRELWGLEPYSAIEHDGGKDDLVFSDFDFRLARAEESSLLTQWDNRLMSELYPESDPIDREYFSLISRLSMPAPAAGPNSRVVVATAPAGDIAGFLWSIESTVQARRYGRMVQLGILPDFRGIGIGTALLRWYHRDAQERGLHMILADLPASADFLVANLKSLGFTNQSASWKLILDEL